LHSQLRRFLFHTKLTGSAVRMTEVIRHDEYRATPRVRDDPVLRIWRGLNKEKVCMRNRILFFLFMVSAVFPATLHAETKLPTGCASGIVKASWYGPGFHGRKTKSGAIFDQENALMVAHPYCPMGTRLSVTNPKTGKKIAVKVVDKGPNQKTHPDRKLDLSRAAAESIDVKNAGVAYVTVEILK
jgi:hypothetical protein